MTKTELRVLQLLSNAGGALARKVLQPQMSRYTQEQRDLALYALVQLELITETSEKAGRAGYAGTTYTLTDAGLLHVSDLQKAGTLRRGKRKAA